MDPGSAGSFRVLLICQANQIRSPIAEMLMKHLLDGTSQNLAAAWVISSAGVQATTGLAMHPMADRLLTARNVPHEGFLTTRVTSEMLGTADLILTAERSHRSQVVSLNPTTLHRTFTIRQFARLLESVPGRTAVPSGPSMVDLAVSRRSLVRVSDPAADEIADPIGRSFRHVRRAADVIQRAVECIVAATGARPAPQIRRPGSR